MQTHGSGPIRGRRQAAILMMHSFPLLFTDTVARKVMTIPGTIAKPVIAYFSLVTEIAYNAGTTNVLGIGSTIAATEIATGAMPAAGVFGGEVPAIFTSVGDIYIKYSSTGTAPTTGRGYVLVRMAELNSSH